MAKIKKPQDADLKFLERSASLLSTVAEAGREIGALLDLDEILELLLDKALASTGGETGSIMMLDGEAGELTLQVHRGTHPYHAVHVSRHLGEGISGWVAQTGEPLHLVRAVRDERFEGVYQEGEIVDALCAPLTYQGLLVGVININHHTTETQFTDDDLHALVALGGYAAVAIQNAGIYHELQEHRKVQEHLLSKVITAQEDERKRVAADIHDGPAQALAGLPYRIETIERLLAIDTDRARGELAKLQDAVLQATQGLRRILVGLRPTLLDDLGLIPALRQHLEGFRVHTGIHAALECFEGPLPLDSTSETVIYRVVQEALNNVTKHSWATEVRVTASLEDGEVVVSVKDNGRGFEPALWVEQGGPERLGIVGMRERARMVGGTLLIRSAQEMGTEVILRVPVEPVQRRGSRGEEGSIVNG